MKSDKYQRDTGHKIFILAKKCRPQRRQHFFNPNQINYLFISLLIDLPEEPDTCKK